MWSCPSAAQSGNLGPSSGAYSKCGSVHSPEPPEPTGTFQSRGNALIYCHLCLYLFNRIPLFIRREPGKEEPASRSQDQAWTPFSFPFTSWRKVKGRTPPASCVPCTWCNRSLLCSRDVAEATGLLGFCAALFILKEELNSCKE